MSSPDQEARMREYATRYGLKFNIKEQLGEGTDGAVWATSNNSVIKVIEREKTFETEFRCYERLMSRRVKVVDGLNVPSLIETMLTQNRGISDSTRTNPRLMTTNMTTTTALRRAKANDWACHTVGAFG